MKLTYDMQGRIVTRAEEVTPGIEAAFKGVDFVTVDKPDLDNVLSLLREIVDQKEYISHNDPRCVSYERLVDINAGVPYPVMLAERDAQHTARFK